MSICASATAAIFVFGNSLCWVGAPTTWPQLLQAQCAATVYSNCSPGRGTEALGWDSVAPLTRFAEKLAEYEPDVAIIDLVTNDHNDGLTPEQSASNLAQYVDAARAAGTEPVLVLPWPINDGWSVDNRGFGLGMTRGTIQALAVGMGVRTVDPSAVFDYRTFKTDCTWTGSSYDGVHPNIASCRQIMAEFLAEVIP